MPPARLVSRTSGDRKDRVATGSSTSTEKPGLSPAFRVSVCLLAAAVLVVLPFGLRHALLTPVESLLWVAVISGANLLVIPMVRGLNVEVTLSAPVVIAAAVVLPPPLTVVVTALAVASDRELHGDRPWWLIVFNRGQVAVAAGAASMTAAVAPNLWVGTVVAVVVFNVVNTAAVAVSLWLRGRADLTQAARRTTAPFPRFTVDFSLVTLLAILLVVAYQQVGAWAVLLLAIPMWLGYHALRSAREAEDRAEQLAARVADLETLNRLGADLLSVRDRAQVPDRGAQALRDALSLPDVEVVLDGGGRQDLRPVPILGAEPAVVRVPHGLNDSVMALVEAVAGLVSMALQRLTLERELADMERARAALSSRILEEGTRERSRIALEIHDEVLPYLAAAGIQADNVRSALAAGGRDRVDELAEATGAAVHDGIARLREVLDALQRQIVVPGGLRSALVDALNELQLRYGIDGELHADDPLPPLPLAVEILVLETVRGCLTNVALHAQARGVAVRLTVGKHRVAVQVGDDGCGFDPAAVAAGHHGLALMAQRVELARGRFTVHSAPGGGTTVEVEVPV